MIKINGLVKRFGERVAVDNINLHIRDGEMFGLLGPNGAGKTTTIRILTMLTKPTTGEVTIGGHLLKPDDSRIKAMIGVVPQHFNLDTDLTARENLELHGRLHHIDAHILSKRIDKALQYVDLADRANDMVTIFSGGMKRRLMIARALIHGPKVLFLDEPTVGLDAQVRRRLWDIIRLMNSDGLTVLLTTHYIEEAENLCGRVAIMDKGKLITTDTPQALCRRLGEFVVEWPGAKGMEYRFFSERGDAGQFAADLTTSATIRKSNLEDVFVELTGRKVVN